MKLYYLLGAPSPNRVRLYLAEKNLAFPTVQIEQVNLSGGLHRQHSHLTRNSLGTVPVLEIGANKFIHESLAIIEYLEEMFPDPPMIGTTAFEKATTRATERVAEMRVFYPLARYVQAVGLQPTRHPDPAIGAHYKEQFPIGLQYLNAQVEKEGPFLMGAHFSIADCTLAAAIDFSYRHGVEALKDYAGLESWYKAVRARHAAVEILL